MRLFVAVVPPPAALEHLADEVGSAPALSVARGPGAVPPDRWHLTLAFLGEVPVERLPAAELAVGCALVAAGGRHDGCVAPVLRLGGGGTFGTPGGGRSGAGGSRTGRGGAGRSGGVLWVGLRGDVAGLAALAGDVRRALSGAGLPVDPKPFRPHLTLARPGRRVPPEQVRAALGPLDGYEGPPWPVEEVRLVRSVLGAGARHEMLRAWRLGHTGPASPPAPARAGPAAPDARGAPAPPAGQA